MDKPETYIKIFKTTETRNKRMNITNGAPNYEHEVLVLVIVNG